MPACLVSGSTPRADAAQGTLHVVLVESVDVSVIDGVTSDFCPLLFSHFLRSAFSDGHLQGQFRKTELLMLERVHRNPQILRTIYRDSQRCPSTALNFLLGIVSP